MAFKCRRWYYKYAKCLAIIVVFIFFSQLYLALKFFPSENNVPLPKLTELKKPSYVREEEGEVSARKYNAAIGDDEDFINNSQQKKTANSLSNKSINSLRLEELDFKPACEITSKEAISAIHRAKTQACKQKIVNTTCLIQSDKFYVNSLPNSCPRAGMTFGKHLGCFQDEKKLRLLSSHYGNYESANSPSACLHICFQAGFPYAGVQYATECFCGDAFPRLSSKLDDTACNMKCPGDTSKICGGYFTMNIYETGLAKFNAQVPNVPDGSVVSVRIVFLLTLNGRALRQVHRLINALYRTNHYFYIHVDARQHYLHRELSVLEKQFPNIKLASKRFSSIWGGASLLEMLLAAMRDIFSLKWQWDFVINLSESDFPIKSLESLEGFLAANKGRNFVKSHGREVQRFIKKQGLDKTFIECDTHMWRIGDRKLPRGIVIDGGSDWIALSPEFVAYVVGEKDELLAGLQTIFKHTLLPAESFFHTALRNSKFCNTYVDNNLHVTNWKRKLGCKCQYKHVVDWCGCSPNDFRAEDWPRIQSTQDRQLFFARKFEPIINQEIITRVEQSIGFTDQYELPNVEAYWQNIYNKEDSKINYDDTLLTHAQSLVRHNAAILGEELCSVLPGDVLEVNSYNYADVYKGNLILHKATIEKDIDVLIETWYKPQKHFEMKKHSEYLESIKIFKVSSDYDQKEQTFRNMAGVLGPLSEPCLLYYFTLQGTYATVNLTVVWLDPAGLIADVNELNINENNLTNFVKPTLKIPLLPGIWRVGLLERTNLISETKFLITPLEFLSDKVLTHQESDIIHSGSQSSYKDYSMKIPDFLPSVEERKKLFNIVEANIKRVGHDLIEWIDNSSYRFYNVLGSCVQFASKHLESNITCGKHKFELCSLSKWSSVAPDPKGHIGKLNNKTGRLERV